MAKKTFEPTTTSGADNSIVAQRAYEIWQREGCPDGRAMEHWLRAEAEIGAQTSAGRSAENLKIRPARRSGKGGESQFQVAGR